MLKRRGSFSPSVSPSKQMEKMKKQINEFQLQNIQYESSIREFADTEPKKTLKVKQAKEKIAQA